MNYIEKRKLLPSKLLDFLSSDEIRWETERVCFMYEVPEDKIKFVSAPTGLIFVGDIKLKDYPKIIAEEIQINENFIYGIAYEINKRIFNKFPDYFQDSGTLLDQWEKLKANPILNEEEAWEKVLKFEPWILDLEKEKLEEKKKEEEEKKKHLQNIVPIKFSQAFKQYPALGEQLISLEYLELRNFSHPVRPSVKNWIADYYENLGAGKHGIMERGNYLFHAKNTKSLTSGERQKVAYIIKALDEDAIITIDKEKNEIVFPLIKNESIIEKQKPKIEKQNYTSKFIAGNFAGKMNFSSPHIFPAEKEIRENQTRPPATSPSRPVLSQFSQAPKLSQSFQSAQTFHSAPTLQNQNLFRPVQQSRPNPYRIAPIGHSRQEVSSQDVNPKTQGNVVDLRN